jgi:hypothetical protein
VATAYAFCQAPFLAFTRSLAGGRLMTSFGTGVLFLLDILHAQHPPLAIRPIANHPALRVFDVAVDRPTHAAPILLRIAGTVRRKVVTGALFYGRHA